MTSRAAVAKVVGLKVRSLLAPTVLAAILLFLFGGPGVAGAGASLAGQTIMVDPGHGGRDPGAVDAVHGIEEATINWEVAWRLARILERDGACVVLTRAPHAEFAPKAGGPVRRYWSVRDRVAVANGSGASLLVSLHVNTFRDPQRKGLEVFYFPASTAGRELAESICHACRASLGTGNVRGEPYSILRYTAMPAVLVELGYLSNISEARQLLRPEYQQRLAETIAGGITDYIARASTRPARVGQAGRVAIVIDDLAGPAEKTGAEALFHLGFPVTVAVLPHYPSSWQLAKRAHRAGMEVLVHMPMEPEGKVPPAALGRGALLTTLPASEIKERVRRAIDSVPYAAGMNNHMGSRATADRRVMRAVMEVLKERGMFFVDSRTTGHSVALEVAREVGVPCLQSDFFLDDVEDEDYIRKRLYDVAARARARGRATAIGHVGHAVADTVAVMEAMKEELKLQGIKFVHVSELIRK